jgi:UbiD family decarboxylase
MLSLTAPGIDGWRVGEKRTDVARLECRRWIAWRAPPVDLVKCKTVDLEVSATAEVSPNFEVDLRKELLEGPLREYTSYYTKKPTARITAITHRRQPYF